MKRNLQTSASQDNDAKEQLEAGHGGSYSIDPVTRAVTLNERTQSASVSHKAEGVSVTLPEAPAAAQPVQAAE